MLKIGVAVSEIQDAKVPYLQMHTTSGIIAVNYEARDQGVTRHMRGAEAKEKCPEIILVSVPALRGKSDTSRYRSAGREVVDVLKKHCSVIERASVDEAYLDITELVDQRMESMNWSQKNVISSLTNTFVVGYCNDENNDEEQRRDGVERWMAEVFDELGDLQSRKLAVAGSIIEELRAEIYSITKFRCSAGISYNKILAKLACGLHKPNRQTILPAAGVQSLYSSLPVKKVRNLGGKFGNIVMESLGCNVMADLMKYSLQDLQKRFDEKTGSWLYNIARGIDNEPVTTRLVCKSIGASKNFPGKQAIVKLDVLKHWVSELSIDVCDRLEQDHEENERRATTLTVTFSYYENRKVISQSRSCPLKSYKPERIASQSLDLITKSTQKPVSHIGIAAAKFVQAKGSGNFVNFFKASGVKLDETSKIESRVIQNEISKSSEKITKAAPKKDESNGIIETNNQESANEKMSSKSTDVNSKISDNAMIEVEENGICDLNESTAEMAKVSDKPTRPVESFFVNQAQSEDELAKSSEPISPSTAILGSTQLKKALNRENLKNSFFINFLKDAKAKVDNTILESSSTSCVDEEESTLYPAISISNPIQQNPDKIVEDVQKQEQKAIEDDNLLLQLQEIFPDLDNIDRSVVQLLPIELQRMANVYLKSKVSQKPQSIKNVSKTSKTKVTKSKTSSSRQGPNSFQNFFVKTDSNASNETTLTKCSDCNQMIQIDKYNEHKDFHVAQDLQRVINQSVLRETNNLNDKAIPTESNSLKRRLSDEIQKSNKKAKSISSFFCR